MKAKKKQSTRQGKEPAFFCAHPVIWMVLLSLTLNLALEMLHRHSVAAAFLFVGENPVAFVCGVLIVLATMLLSLLVPKRLFTQLLIGVVWLALGVTEWVVLFFRTLPFSAMDMQLIFSVSSVFNDYLEPWQIIGILAAAAAAIALLVAAWIRLPKGPWQWKKGVAAVCVTAVLLLATFTAGKYTGKISNVFYNLADAYDQYGFSYCFAVSIFDRGIDRPQDYSDETVSNILSQLKDAPMATERHPNIIFVQLESFTDPAYVNWLTCSENPIPVFSDLKEHFAHGFLTVPSVGTGTANTEFEVMTGMSLRYFGAGEFPYQTILKSSTCESVNYNLKAYDYRCHAIHNNSATFYGRYSVYSMLGFDTYTSIEYMDDVQYNPIGWAEDDVLTQQILDALEESDKRDFIYAISVQAHGKYPVEPLDNWQPTITAEGCKTPEEQIQWEYFLDQLRETDRFVGNLIDALKAQKEPVVLVLFGDHQPNLELEQGDLSNGNLFQTEYVIWDNFNLNAQSEDLYSYQLAARVQELLGLSSGELTKLHQDFRGNEEYQTYLETLEYDMLYGDQVSYQGENPYQQTDLQMGVKPISITSASREGETVSVSGTNFTPYSVVLLDGEPLKTTFVDNHTLQAHVKAGKTGDLTVAQVDRDGVMLSTTDQAWRLEE